MYRLFLFDVHKIVPKSVIRTIVCCYYVLSASETVSVVGIAIEIVECYPSII